MGAIKVHEFITLDGVIEDPTWTMGFGFDPDGAGRCRVVGLLQSSVLSEPDDGYRRAQPILRL